MEQDDYATELLAKWTSTGHLSGVNEQFKTHVAARLEAAYRRSLGSRPDFDALAKELDALRHEGYFGKGPNERTSVHLRQVRRKTRHRSTNH